MLAELAALREIISEHAALLIELVHDRDELMAARRSHVAAPPGLTPLKNACGQSGYDRRSVVRWARAGAIVGRRVGGRWFVDVDSLRKYVRVK